MRAIYINFINWLGLIILKSLYISISSTTIFEQKRITFISIYWGLARLIIPQQLISSTDLDRTQSVFCPSLSVLNRDSHQCTVLSPSPSLSNTPVPQKLPTVHQLSQVEPRNSCVPLQITLLGGEGDLNSNLLTLIICV